MLRSLAMHATIGLLATASLADTVTYHFSATVSRLSPTQLALDDIAGVSVGDVVTGSFTVDLDAVGTPAVPEGVGQYPHGLLDIVMMVRGLDLKYDGPSSVFIRADAPIDTFELNFGAVLSGHSVNVYLGLFDGTSEMFPNSAIVNAQSLCLCATTSQEFQLQFPDLPAPLGYQQVIVAEWNTLSVVPQCAADFNREHGVTVQDIYDFLSTWNLRLPTADFNGVNGVTVQDAYDFLAAWNAGCP